MKLNTNNGFDNLSIYDNIRKFFQETEERIYRFWVYRRVFTPLEQEKKYMDQSQYEETHARFGIIREMIPLPDGDVLLGFAELFDDIAELSNEETQSLGYYKLSEIRLAYYPNDVREFNYGT